jgi:hypothetical protein
MASSGRSSLLLESEGGKSSFLLESGGSCYLSSEADDCLTSPILYFAFGSNLNTKRIRLKNPSARYLKVFSVDFVPMRYNIQ